MANFLKSQTDGKNRIKAHEFMADQEAACKAQALLDQQEKNFYSYAEQCISQWQADGKNVKPIIMELKNYKKRIV